MERTHSSISLVGIGAQASNKTRDMVSFQLSPHFTSNFSYTMTAHVLTNLTSSIPSTHLNTSSWQHLKGLQLAQFSRPDAIDIILGADVYGAIITEGLIKKSQDAPIAQRTELGWIISGPTSQQITLENPQSYHVTTNEDLHSVLHKFWELEEVPFPIDRSLTPEEQDCESHFRNTHTRDQHGRQQCYVFSSDIEKMYRQINVHKND
ncbi:PREDICTED: uncharacterized protein LOC105449729 [Wasmannia auropunctata]|uniref:uncharacterized protein LOC105449729 n=1 Tax=Wasmannia auropunctata TaxID=64793 RepID=UPI0005EEC909|nr:PREDICTED: uncharacterized protein LOC105449729 [Wasmannia auropunctata]